MTIDVPGRAPSELMTAPAPVWKPQPRGPSSSSFTSSAVTFTTLRSVAIACDAKLDWPNQQQPMREPSSPDSGVEPSRREPMKFSGPNSSQYCGRPVSQFMHLPQLAYDRTTLSPGATFVTPSPTRSTMPEPSWPSTIGEANGAPGMRARRSVWHMPAPTMRTSTSPGRGSPSSS